MHAERKESWGAFPHAFPAHVVTEIGVVTLGLSFQWLSRVSTLSALYGKEETELPDATSPTMPHSSTYVYECLGRTGEPLTELKSLQRDKS